MGFLRSGPRESEPTSVGQIYQGLAARGNALSTRPATRPVGRRPFIHANRENSRVEICAGRAHACRNNSHQRRNGAGGRKGTEERDRHPRYAFNRFIKLLLARGMCGHFADDWTADDWPWLFSPWRVFTAICAKLPRQTSSNLTLAQHDSFFLLPVFSRF